MQLPLPSGQGSSTQIPTEIEQMGFNWGAWLLGPIWCLGNGWSFLDAWLFGRWPTLGQNGNRQAWQKRTWTSIALFKATQRKWALLGFLTLGLVIIMLIGLMEIMANLASSQPSQSFVLTLLQPFIYLFIFTILVTIFFLRRKRK